MSDFLSNKIDFAAITAPEYPEAGQYRIGIDTADDVLKIMDSTGAYFAPLPETKTVGGESIFGSGDIPVGGGGGFGITDITFAALKALYDLGTMVVGYYRITDYETIYTRPDFDAGGNAKAAIDLVTGTGPIEPLIVFATDVDKLSAHAFSESYPYDKIKYDITFDATDVKGDAAKGRIIERIDELNNRADYDHRAVQFKRYDDGGGVFSVVNDNGNASQLFYTFNAILATLIQNNDVGDMSFLVPLAFGPTYPILSNNVFVSTNGLIGTKFGFLCGNNTIINDGTTVNTKFDVSAFSNVIVGSGGTDISENNFNVGCSGNTIKTPGEIINNEFGFNFSDNTLDGGTYSNNRFKYSNTNNQMIGDFNFNDVGSVSNSIFGDGANNNKIGPFNTMNVGINFSGNEIGSNNSNITMGDDCQNNIFGNGNDLTVGNNCTNNNFGSNNTNTQGINTIQSNDFKDNVLQGNATPDLSAATHILSSYFCDVYKRQDGTAKLTFINNSDALTVVNAGA